MIFKSDKEFDKAFKIFQGEVRLLLNSNRLKRKEEFDSLINSDKYRNLAIPHLSRFRIYKNFVNEFVNEVTDSFRSIFIAEIQINIEKQNEVFQHIKNMLDVERQKIINEEEQILKRKNTGQNISLIINGIYVLFDLPLLEFKENVMLHFEKSELSETIKVKKEFKNRMSDIKWKILWFIIAFILGTIFGYLLKLLTQPNPQIKATALNIAALFKLLS
jgi:hypothetical protein